MTSDYHDPAEYDAVPDDLKVAVQKWIELVIQPAKTKCRHDSYGLKHLFEQSIPEVHCLYMTNGEFKGAMLAAGYEPVRRTEPHWTFHVKTRSHYRRFSKRHLDGYGYTFGNFCVCHVPQEQREVFETLARAVQPREF